jgi:two-component system, NtrC family, sensor kinase
MSSAAAPRTSPRKRWGLQPKLILSMLMVGVLPLLVGLGMAFWQGSREIQEVSGESFKALAAETARKLDLLVAEEVSRTSRIARDPAIVGELERRRDAHNNLRSREGLRAVRAVINEDAARWEAKDPALVKAVTESNLSALLHTYHTSSQNEPEQILPQVVRAATKMLFITDVQGSLVASLTTLPKYSNGSSVWWIGAYNKGIGQLYIEDVQYHEQARTYAFTLSLPIMDSLHYEVVGIVHRVIDSKEFFSPSIQPIRFGKTGHVMLIDSRGIVMSCPILPTGVSLSDTSLIPLVTPFHPGWVAAPSDGHGGRSTSIIGFAPLPETSRATNGVLEAGSWNTFVWQSSDELFAPIHHLFTWMTVFGLVAVCLLVALGYLAANRIVQPIRQLQQAAESIGRGELRQRIQIQTGDELEALAEDFNRMNKQLEAAFAGLTDQVALKTQEVQSLERSTDQILDAVPTPILMVDAQAQVQYVNRAAQESLGLTLSLPASTSLFDILPLDVSAQHRLRKEFVEREDTALPSVEMAEVPADEPRDPLVPTLTGARANGRSELRLGQRVYHYQWFRTDGRPGEGPRLGLVLRDTTDESRVQDQLIQAEKSGSLGVLTAGIGHELNNPLFGILGLGEAIQEEADIDHVRAHARDIVQHGRRMAAIIRDFTGMTARDTGGRLTPVDVHLELDQALTALQTTQDLSQLEIHKTYACRDRVSANPEQLRQAFVNILTNAVQAMAGRGTLCLTTTVDNNMVAITIQDSGHGIPSQHLSKVFDPFFTMKGQGEGSGLGLTVARRIVRKFGGDIRIENLEGGGVCCTISLPVIRPTSAPQEVSWTASGIPSAPHPSSSSS